MKTLNKKLKYMVLIPIFLICIQNAHSLDITGIEAQGFYRGEYTRGNDFLNELSAIGNLELEEKLMFRGGLAVGKTIVDTEINTLLSAIYTPFSDIPLGVSVSYIYNGLPEYKTHANSIIPLISYKANIAGISVGVNLRFTRFFSESAQFESILSFYGYFNFINTEIVTIGIGAGNINNFHTKNLGAFSLDLNSKIKLNDNWLVINEIELMQSGADGLTTNLYGMAFRTGVKYSW